MLLSGTTTVEAKSGYGLEFEAELRQLRALRRAALDSPVRILATAIPLHDVPPEHRTDGKKQNAAWIREVERDLLPVIVAEGLADFADVFCDDGYFTPEESEAHLRFAAEIGLRPRIHADELATSGGSEVAARVGALSADHLLRIDDAGIRALAEAGVVATILPGTALYLMEGVDAPARKLLEAGCAVAVATDFNPGSCPSDNLALMAALACFRNRLTIREAITAITLNGAAALGLAAKTGSLEAGKQADVVVLDARSHTELIARFGSPLVRHVVAGGTVAVRDGRRQGAAVAA